MTHPFGLHRLQACFWRREFNSTATFFHRGSKHACIVSLYHGRPHVNQPSIEATRGENLVNYRVLRHEYARHVGEGASIDHCSSTNRCSMTSCRNVKIIVKYLLNPPSYETPTAWQGRLVNQLIGTPLTVSEDLKGRKRLPRASWPGHWNECPWKSATACDKWSVP